MGLLIEGREHDMQLVGLGLNRVRAPRRLPDDLLLDPQLRVLGRERRLHLLARGLAESDDEECTVGGVGDDGSVGDGKIFVIDVGDAMRIRTGEKGTSAL